MSDYQERKAPPITAEERAARKAKSDADAVVALAERRAADEAFRANFARLRAERQARERA